MKRSFSISGLMILTTVFALSVIGCGKDDKKDKEEKPNGSEQGEQNQEGEKKGEGIGLAGKIESKDFKIGSIMAGLKEGEFILYVSDSKDPAVLECDGGLVVSSYQDGNQSMKEYDSIVVKFKSKVGNQKIGTDASASFISANVVGENEGSSFLSASDGNVNVSEITDTTVKGTIDIKRLNDSESSDKISFAKGSFNASICKS